MSLRKNLIAISLFSAAKLLKEQEMAPPPPDASAAPAPEGVMGETPTDDEGNPLTLEKLTDRMNIIRSGLSFKDPEVFGKLTSFYKALSTESKQILHKQLSDIGAIVQSQNPAQGGENGAPAAPPAPPAPPAPVPPTV
jgi:hypothetical protein